MNMMIFKDSLMNFISGLGTSKDKGAQNVYSFGELDKGQLDAAYRGDWIARKTIDIPAQDSTRAWRSWQATDDQIEKLEAIEKQLRIRRKVRLALTRGRLYGGGALILGVGSDHPKLPLNVEKVKAGDLKFVHAVSRHELQSQELNLDVQSEYYGEPIRYIVQPTGKEAVEIHPSRVIRFVGNELPDINLSSDGWGDSILQSVDDAIKNAGVTSASISALIHEAKIDILRIPNLMANIMTKDYKSQLMERVSLANMGKSLTNALMLDKEEEWQRATVNFGGMTDVLLTYLAIAAAAADIPATRFLGSSAKGLNATGEGDLRNYYDNVNSNQENELTPNLERLDEILIRSALGTRDPAVYYDWKSLWQMSPTEKATISYQKAQAHQIDVQAGLIDPDALRKGRENQLIEDGVYPGLEAALEEAEANGIDGDVNEDDPEVKAQFEGESNVVAIGTSKRLKDAEPRSLYVRRDVLNADEILAWAKEQGFKSVIPGEQMHVTVVFSRAKLDWMKIREDFYGNDKDGELEIAPGGPRLVERLGATKDAVVLMFNSSALCYRHESIQAGGASWDWPEYQPHITISFDAPDVDVTKLEPYRGKIVLGPEIFEEVNENWKSTVKEEET